MRNWFRKRLLAGGLLAAAVFPGGALEAQAEPPPTTDGTAASLLRFEREGISVELAMQNLDASSGSSSSFREGDLVRFRFQITDTTTGTPLSGVFPAAWMDLRPKHEEAGDNSCRDKVEAFVGGSLLTPPELDLNIYHVLSLNNDATISVVDPLFGFGSTKLLSMVFLESPGEDWTLTPDQQFLFVSMPKAGKVAVASMTDWKVKENIDVGPQPRQVRLQSDGHYLWVAYEMAREGEALSGVSVIDAQERTLVATIPTGRGRHHLALSDDNRYAFVTNELDATVSVLDIGSLKKIRDIPAGGRLASLDYSSIAQSAYAVDQESGRVFALRGDAPEPVGVIQSEAGIGQIRFAPDGRLGFLVNTELNVVHIIDASLNKIIQTGDVEEGPDQIAFSDELAYVRHQDSELILMIPLDQVGVEGRPIPLIDFTGGQNPFGKGRQSSASSIVQAPGASAVLVANPADRTIYYYKEGMAAPMGHFQNYGRQPRAVLAVDRSLRERSPGAYETVAALRRPGDYDVAFLLDAPRMIHCFPVKVEANPELMAARARQAGFKMESLVKARTLKKGDSVALRFKLIDPVGMKPFPTLSDVEVMAFRAPGVDRSRLAARDQGEGIYEVEFQPAEAGAYYLFVGCASLGIEYDEAPLAILRVLAPEPAPGSPVPGEAASNGRRIR